jgi:hypothetical protein
VEKSSRLAQEEASYLRDAQAQEKNDTLRAEG